ncbi:DUF6454 family protein [Sphingomonas adhaesiva]|uniref:DUF6454 family protein n=1 Tax=Sphingomonas adhaesiva TaxID=28212 RepID=UPI002FFC89D9
MFRRSLRPVLIALLFLLPDFSTAASSARPDGIEAARLLDTLHLDGELFHVQGLAMTATRIWVTSVDRGSRRGYLHEFERSTGRFLRRLELTDGARYHPGGISVAGGSIWIPVAEMRPDSSADLVQIDADTFRIRRRVSFPDHLGCVAIAGDRLIAGNWDSRLFYVFDLTGQQRTRVVRNPSATHYQDMKFVDGVLVAGGDRGLFSGTVDWIDWPSMTVARTLRAGAIGPVRPFGRGGPYTGEGMTIEGRDLYVVPEDGPSRVFRFRLDA